MWFVKQEPLGNGLISIGTVPTWEGQRGDSLNFPSSAFTFFLVLVSYNPGQALAESHPHVTG